MTEEKAIYLNLRHHLKPFRSKQYMDWLHKKHGKELHHLFGSFTAHKTSDYFVLPVTRGQHELAERNKSEFAINHLAECLNHLQEYIQELEKNNG